MNWTVVAILAVANFPIYLILGRLLFKDMDGFVEAVVFWFKPDFLSMFQGEFFEDFWAELKLGFFFACCGGLIYFEYPLVLQTFPGLGA